MHRSSLATWYGSCYLLDLLFLILASKEAVAYQLANVFALIADLFTAIRLDHCLVQI